MILNCVAEFPGPVDFATRETCNNSIAITWDALLESPCPITGYMIDVESTTVSVTAGATSFNYSLGENSCGRTYQISVYAINAVGIGNKRFINQPITCTRKGTTMSVIMMHKLICDFKVYYICSIARSLHEFYFNN